MLSGQELHVLAAICGRQVGVCALELARSRMKCFLANRSMYMCCNTRSDASYRTSHTSIRNLFVLAKVSHGKVGEYSIGLGFE